jgi:hypothetical protein
MFRRRERFCRRETMIALRARRQAIHIVRDLVYGPTIELPKPPPPETALPAPDPNALPLPVRPVLVFVMRRSDLTRVYVLTAIMLIAAAVVLAILNLRWMYL